MNSQLTQVRKCCREGNFMNAYKSIRQLNSHDFDYWILYCEICLELEMFKKADRAISDAIHINNTSAYAWYLKAKVCIGLNDCKKALKASKRALSIDEKEEYLKMNEDIEYFLNTSYHPKYANNCDNLVELTKKENINMLDEKMLNKIDYRILLDDIITKTIENTDLQGDILTKIKNFAQNIMDVDFSFKSYDLGEKRRLAGAYSFNNMKIDSNFIKTLQIAIIIHELAHHLLSEIFKHTMMYVYDSEKTDTIEAFSWYCITHDIYLRLMNEYCAHSVECYYMPYNYQNYESFNLILSKYDGLNEDKIIKAVQMANSLAEDIIYMLNYFITDDFKEEIKMQYLSDKFISSRIGPMIINDKKYDDITKFKMINSILRQNLLYVKINQSYSEVYMYKRIFNKVNEG